ncbi:MAG: hypothetical protein AABY18_01380 [Candidatus Thermoplasmatota archaeon]
MIRWAVLLLLVVPSAGAEALTLRIEDPQGDHMANVAATTPSGDLLAIELWHDGAEFRVRVEVADLSTYFTDQPVINVTWRVSDPFAVTPTSWFEGVRFRGDGQILSYPLGPGPDRAALQEGESRPFNYDIQGDNHLEARWIIAVSGEQPFEYSHGVVIDELQATATNGDEVRVRLTPRFDDAAGPGSFMVGSEMIAQLGIGAVLPSKDPVKVDDVPASSEADLRSIWSWTDDGGVHIAVQLGKLDPAGPACHLQANVEDGDGTAGFALDWGDGRLGPVYGSAVNGESRLEWRTGTRVAVSSEAGLVVATLEAGSDTLRQAYVQCGSFRDEMDFFEPSSIPGLSPLLVLATLAAAVVVRRR